MKAGETTFVELIQGNKQFLVPLYQRTYSWQSEQLGRLWDDILEKLQDENGSSASTHFLGSVVLAPGVVQAAIARWIVVDGQQRLTTLMLAMCALRDHLAATGTDERDRFNDWYLTNSHSTGDGYLRLLPTRADIDSYQACIRSTADAGGPDNIGGAYRFFRERLAASEDRRDPFNPADVEDVIARRLALVEITADKGDNVHRIFESLNNTGLALTQADLVRNQIFMLLPTQADAVYSSVWLPLQGRLTTDQLEDLVYLHLVLTGRPRVRRDGIARAMEDELSNAKDEAAVEGIVRTLDRRSRHLERIVRPDRETDPRLRASFRRLGVWGAQVTYPLLMLVLDREESGAMTSDGVASLLGFIESFLVRRMIARVPTNNLNRIFNGLVAQAPAEGDVTDAVREYLSRPRNFWPNDAELREAIRSKPFYLQGRNQQKQLVLQRLEEAFGSKETPDFSTVQYTIEHVLPQTPTQDWLDMLAPYVEGDETPEQLHQRLVHTLGNLTLTAYNSELSNNPFQRKQDMYRSSGLEMNRQLAEKSEWGSAEILERADKLADLAVNVWPGPLPSVSAPGTGYDWSLLHQAMAAMPAGSWTTYSDLAALVGSHPVPVGMHLASTHVVNGHRALKADGSISEGFRWSSPDDHRDPRDVLLEEGVRFDANGLAEPSQRLTASDLALLVGLDSNGVSQTAEWSGEVLPTDEGQRKFISQLEQLQGPVVAGAVQRITDEWVALGCRLTFGTASQTTCFLSMGTDWSLPWPGGIYPAGQFELAFKPMAARAPFDDLTLRDEFRRRLNLAPGIDISSAKLALYPSVPLRLLAEEAPFAAVRDALQWFVEQVRLRRGVQSITPP